MRRGQTLRLAAGTLAAALALVVAVPAAALAYSGSSDTAAPMVSSAVVDGDKLTVEFGELMQGTFDADDWTWAIDGEDQGHPHLVMWIGGLGRAKLTVSPAVVGGQQVTLSYTPGDGSLLRDGAGNHLAALEEHPVRNDSPVPPQPVLVVTLDLDDVTEETRQLADGDGQDPPVSSDTSDGRSDAQRQIPDAVADDAPDSEPLIGTKAIGTAVDSVGGSSQDHAQSFTTGTHRWGYALTSVSFDICFGFTSADSFDNACDDRPPDTPDPTYQISLWTARRVPADGNRKWGYYVPDTQVAAFDKANNDPLAKNPLVPVLVPGTTNVFVNKPDTAHNSFTVNGGAVLLDPDTAYVVVFDFTSTRGSNPQLTRTGDGGGGDFGWVMQTNTARRCHYPPNQFREPCRDGDLAPWERWHAHLTRPASAHGADGWASPDHQGNHKYRLQIDGYEYKPPLLQELNDNYAQASQCGGQPMPWPSYNDALLRRTYFCHTPSGTWVDGRFAMPGEDYARDDQLRPPEEGGCGSAPGSSWDPIRKTCIHRPPNQCTAYRPENCPNREEP